MHIFIEIETKNHLFKEKNCFAIQSEKTAITVTITFVLLHDIYMKVRLQSDRALNKLNCTLSCTEGRC